MSSGLLDSQRLGATFHPELRGTQFSVYVGARAEKVELCLFESIEDSVASRTIDAGASGTKILHASGRIHTVFVEGVHPGQLYGYRVHGPYDPRHGARYNGAKLLLDPYAKAIGRSVRWHDALYGYDRISHDDLRSNNMDSAPFAPLGMVVGPSDFDWRNDRPPNIPWRKTIVYEAHVKGQTMRHPGVDPRLRGSYLGASSAAHRRHLKRMRVTAFEPLPIHKSPPSGLFYRNFWNYDTMAFFAPNRDYSAFRRALDGTNEFKQMVREFHEDDIEVILDVVYNHSAEGNHRGPTLSFRGFANEDYYLLCGSDEDGPYRWYRNLSGCGNAINVNNPAALRMILDSLRWWVTEYHVDGFRFDLATILALGNDLFDPKSPFLQAVRSDPILSKVKLIAEPWHPGLHALGKYPAPWREWNDGYRDDVRKFWRGDSGLLLPLTYRLDGSRDNFKPVSDDPEVEGRGEAASVNFVTCHDGFCLADLVRYAHKHNENNGEENRDGTNDNHSANYGCEGETTDEGINALRRKQQRNFVMTLAVSNGVIQVNGGDELDRRLGGNNNAYPHDSELNYLDWENAPEWLLAFFEGAFALRDRFDALAWMDDLTRSIWLTPEGRAMVDENWQDGNRRVAMRLFPSFDNEAKEERMLLLVVNAHWDIDFDCALPQVEGQGQRKWMRLADTSLEEGWFNAVQAEGAFKSHSRSVQLYLLA